MAGGGAFSIDWARVQPKIAENTRVGSYDRAGLAWSDPGPDEETVEETVNDLHSLLHVWGERAPYVLVGASIGGIFIQAYQRAFSGDGAALVFTNSANRVGLALKNRGGLIWELSEEELRSAFPLPASVKPNPAPTREDEPFDRLPSDLQKMRLWLDLRLWQKSDPSKARPDSLLSWRKEFLREFDETDSGKKPPLGSLPVVVVASDPAAPQSARRSRDKAAPRLDYLSSNTLHITAAGSGHEIHLYQPDRVIEGITRSVSGVRTGTPLAPPIRPTEANFSTDSSRSSRPECIAIETAHVGQPLRLLVEQSSTPCEMAATRSSRRGLQAADSGWRLSPHLPNSLPPP